MTENDSLEQAEEALEAFQATRHKLQEELTALEERITKSLELKGRIEGALTLIDTPTIQPKKPKGKPSTIPKSQEPSPLAVTPAQEDSQKMESKSKENKSKPDPEAFLDEELEDWEPGGEVIDDVSQKKPSSVTNNMLDDLDQLEF